MTPALRILEPGIAATLQDCGRPGYQRFGVPVSGALDLVSLGVANILAGNSPCTAAIEILGAGLALEVEAESAALALAGAAAPLTIESRETALRVPLFTSVTVRRGDIIRIPPLRDGAVSYLAVEGGFDIAPALASLSTYRRAGLGGYRGRALIVGDRLPLCAASSNRASVSLDVDIRPPALLRAMRGPNAAHFGTDAFEILILFRIHSFAGIRQDGPAAARAASSTGDRWRAAIARHGGGRHAGARRWAAHHALGRPANDGRLSVHRNRDRRRYRCGLARPLA